MNSSLLCYRCGSSLSQLSLPLSRYDECPSCTVHLRVCRMCSFYDAGVPKKCSEDDAEEVTEKERLNFCDFFTPGDNVFDGKAASKEAAARTSLASLFGNGDESAAEPSAENQAAEDLFK